MEMRCYRGLLGISYKDHITNEEVSRIVNAIGPHVDLQTIVRQRKLKWYGHTTRSSGLAKTIMQGTVNGGRRGGRQKKSWDDNIKEWTGFELRNTLRKAEDREEWKAVIKRDDLRTTIYTSVRPGTLPGERERVRLRGLRLVRHAEVTSLSRPHPEITLLKTLSDRGELKVLSLSASP
ncbi:retrovirus-related pol polyprotein line-1 [Plakobranchus ocellatus]|uniref:Retrovirus-related pol polyprotein line-1 n=1 Tax=Plakobranchus ocellatus TaxID=259542 RepID=A0AAV3ZWQ5_9GAST|nr:retrovirus-related pol polyprotein line-1 [Plakobranchus ocellatus]